MDNQKEILPMSHEDMAIEYSFFRAEYTRLGKSMSEQELALSGLGNLIKEYPRVKDIDAKEATKRINAAKKNVKLVNNRVSISLDDKIEALAIRISTIAKEQPATYVAHMQSTLESEDKINSYILLSNEIAKVCSEQNKIHYSIRNKESAGYKAQEKCEARLAELRQQLKPLLAEHGMKTMERVSPSPTKEI